MPVGMIRSRRLRAYRLADLIAWWKGRHEFSMVETKRRVWFGLTSPPVITTDTLASR